MRCAFNGDRDVARNWLKAGPRQRWFGLIRWLDPATSSPHSTKCGCCRQVVGISRELRAIALIGRCRERDICERPACLEEDVLDSIAVIRRNILRLRSSGSRSLNSSASFSTRAWARRESPPHCCAASNARSRARPRRITARLARVAASDPSRRRKSEMDRMTHQAVAWNLHLVPKRRSPNCNNSLVPPTNVVCLRHNSPTWILKQNFSHLR